MIQQNRILRNSGVGSGSSSTIGSTKEAANGEIPESGRSCFSASVMTGLQQWIQNNPQLAISGALCLGVSLGWLLKERR